MAKHETGLSAFDEYPIHQAAELIRHVTTGDRNFYDRYYFNCHACSDDLFLVVGLGQYPNLGVQDAFATIRRGDTHRVVRASRELGDRSDVTVGPFAIEVLEPLRRLRVALGPNEHGLELDLVWDGSGPAFEEPRHQTRQFGRMIIDTMRFAQVGRWSGTITLDDSTVIEVTPDRWWGNRDRSWGVRPVGEAEPAGIAGGHTLAESGFMWNYFVAQFDDHCVLYMCQERNDGSRDLGRGVRVWADPDRPKEELGRPEHHHVLVSGTREVASSRIEFPLAPAGPMAIELEQLLPCYLGLGSGYGFDADWRHGMYQGELVVQGMELSHGPGSDDHFWGLVDSVARFAYDGREGYGLHEYGFFGPFDRYGLTGLLDPAP